ncbi:MAG: plasmid stabilization system protein [Oscillatoriales cyanobacterium SM2_1_8]|nr:plasmid stabilization system protein [Oscillatoriales cyanobacterium SM2_1_8]
MKTFVFEPSFKRAFKALTRRNPEIEHLIAETLNLLTEDPFAPQLKSHKLKGDFSGAWACKVL